VEDSAVEDDPHFLLLIARIVSSSNAPHTTAGQVFQASASDALGAIFAGT